MLGGYVVAQPKVSARRMVLILAGLLICVTTTVLGGTRSSMLIVIVTFLVALLTLRLRYLPIGAGVLAVAAVLWFSVVMPMLPRFAVQRTIDLASLEQGASVRVGLIQQAMTILHESPAFGRTLALGGVIGLDYSHNFTIQVLVETGLVGFVIYAVAVIAILRKTVRLLAQILDAVHRGRPAVAADVQRHVGSPRARALAQPAPWMLLGLLAGHAVPQPESAEELELESALAAGAR